VCCVAAVDVFGGYVVVVPVRASNVDERACSIALYKSNDAAAFSFQARAAHARSVVRFRLRAGDQKLLI
jgi:hypothetical protein